jgi:hypothetical protein
MHDDARPLISLPIAAALLVFAGGLLDVTVFFDGDPYWHVAVGQWIATHHAVPVSDMYSFTHPGMPWTAHEWLSEVLMFVTFRAGGWPAVQILMSAMFALTVGMMLRFLLDRMSVVTALTACLVCVGLMTKHFYGRPHVLVWPLTAVWLSALVSAGERKVAPSYWLLPLFVLWVNLHASFTFGIALAGALGIDACTSTADHDDRRRLTKRWVIFLLLTALCALINPRGVFAITHAAAVMQLRATLDIVAEWKSADFHHFQFLAVWIALVLMASLTGRLRLSPMRIVIVVGLLYLALKHQRYHALVGLVSPFVLARPLGEGLRRAAKSSASDEARSGDVTSRLARRASRAGLLITGCAALGIIAACRSRIATEPSVYVTPAAAVRAVEARGPVGNVFNAYLFGGYLIFRGIPVFVDGRGDMYGDAVMTEVDNATHSRTPHALDSLLARYRIDWTLLRPGTPTVELLDHMPAWTRLYADSVAVVHVRRDGDSRAGASRDGDATAPASLR